MSENLFSRQETEAVVFICLLLKATGVLRKTVISYLTERCMFVSRCLNGIVGPRRLALEQGDATPSVCFQRKSLTVGRGNVPNTECTH